MVVEKVSGDHFPLRTPSKKEFFRELRPAHLQAKELSQSPLVVHGKFLP
jgi:hypothetical protein